MTIPAHAYSGKTVLVAGLGKSGLSAARALQEGHAEVFVWDDGEAARKAAAKAGFSVADPESLKFDALVLSPGVPLTHPQPHPAVIRARRLGAEIIGDIDLLALACPRARYIGITGTNGKSTTTALIGHIMEQDGEPVSIGGNLGTPPLDLQPMGDAGSFVLETSSYQLDLVQKTRFHIAILLNVTPDHLDRHGGMEGYVKAKARIFRNQRPGDVAIIGVDDPHCRAVAGSVSNSNSQVIPISVTAAVERGVYARHGKLYDSLDGEAVAVLSLDEAATLPGLHNAQNIAAAYAAARAAGVPRNRIIPAILSFPGLPHRQHLVAEADGIAFVNDSKATNAEAAARALACYDRIYWIAGGREKEGGYDLLSPHLKNIRHAFLIGEGAENIGRFLAGKVAAADCGDLEPAIRQATALARDEGARGAVVLLSPACASFDQFPSFEVRGTTFTKVVQSLIEEGATAQQGAPAPDRAKPRTAKKGSTPKRAPKQKTSGVKPS